eukprot:TRINITY_DN2486_c0_g2_i2.p1 TRINITY_DN2486_c0_g2~~TRINITY_DN2486_c0_g2_i2.p1  ORF type:complete len:621 (-),score=127.56 TRINITY_DN2486_c0_g2_i2:104-1909(-)
MDSGIAFGVLVAGQDAGRLIGKAGSGLKSVREMSQCKVDLRKEADAQGARKCEVHGPSVEHIASAVHAIASRLFQDGQMDCTMTIAFPTSYAGAVIGKGGDNLKRIREATGVKLTLEKDAISDGDRIGTLSGDRNQLGAAARIALTPLEKGSTGGGASGAVSTRGRVGGGYEERAYEGGYGAAYSGARQMQSRQAAAPTSARSPSYSQSSIRSPSYSAAAVAPIRSSQFVPSASDGITQVKRSSGDANEVQLHMVVPGKFIGAILGKEGAQVKRIKEESGCSAVSATKRETGHDRRVVFMGGLEQCIHAQQAVHRHYCQAASEAQEDVTSIAVIFLVPQAAAGAVIGKQGANLNEIRERTGLKVDLARDQVEGYRPCTMTGSFDGILQAEGMIQDHVIREFEKLSDTGGQKRPRDTMEDGLRGGLSDNGTKRPRVLPVENVVISKLLVPGRSAGAVIGKQGATLKEIRESTGVHVQMLSSAEAPQWKGERVVVIKGNLAGRQDAVARVLQLAFKEDEEASVKLLVESSKAGGIIGKQGANLKAIRERCSVAVQVGRDDYGGERMVTAVGQLDSVLNAVAMVLDAADSPPPSKTGLSTGGLS